MLLKEISFIFTIIMCLIIYDFLYRSRDIKKTGEGESQYIRSLSVWKKIKGYFNFSQTIDDPEKTHENKITKSSAVLYSAYNHGIYPTSGTLYGIHGGKCILKDRSVLLVTNDVLFSLPIVNRIATLFGCVSADRDVIEDLLDKGRSLLIHPEGVQSMLITRTDMLNLYIDPKYEFKQTKRKKRRSTLKEKKKKTLISKILSILSNMNEEPREHRGFLDIAWEKEKPVCPIFNEGENQIYKVWHVFPTMRYVTTKLIGYAFPTFFFGPLPGKTLTSHIGPIITPLKGLERKEQFIKRFYTELFKLIKKYNKQPISDNIRTFMKKLRIKKIY
jgi:hypothetical protein